MLSIKLQLFEPIVLSQVERIGLINVMRSALSSSSGTCSQVGAHVAKIAAIQVF